MHVNLMLNSKIVQQDSFTAQIGFQCISKMILTTATASNCQTLILFRCTLLNYAYRDTAHMHNGICVMLQSVYTNKWRSTEHIFLFLMNFEMQHFNIVRTYQLVTIFNQLVSSNYSLSLVPTSARQFKMKQQQVFLMMAYGFIHYKSSVCVIYTFFS